MKFFQTIMLTLFVASFSWAQKATIKGKVVDTNNKPISYATVFIAETNKAAQTNEKGDYVLEGTSQGKQTIKASYVGYTTAERTLIISEKDAVVNFVLIADSELENITVYGRSNKNVKKLQNLTRLPLGLQDQIQSISIVPDHIIKEQGALSITDAARNVAGVIQFASYGGVRESMSMRGFRGTPVLRNGVEMDSDFRTASGIMDMQGVESVEVIKGSAAILQGIGNGLGSAGGVINLVTKTPDFRNRREVAFRSGSYGQIRPTVDIEQVLDKAETISFRLNGAYERGDGWRTYVNNEHFYINPSLSWKIDNKTRLTLEMDYLDADKTPDRGTVNLAPDYVNGLYKMPHNKFLGFKGDNSEVIGQNYVVRFERELTDKLSIRTSYVNSVYKNDSRETSVGTVKRKTEITDWDDFKMIKRSVGVSKREDYNSLFQVDFVGKDIFTGALKHTFQLGFDFRQNKLITGNGKGLNPDGSAYASIVDVTGLIDNTLPEDVQFEDIHTSQTISPTVGVMAQDYIEIGNRLSAMLGVRYSRLNGNTTEKATVERWNPMFGLIFKPQENISTFISYTTTSSLRQSNASVKEGDKIVPAGASDTKQIEFGFKSNWFNDHLGVNFTYFFIEQNNLLAPYIDPIDNTQVEGVNIFAGDLKRNGFELEINGKITNNLEVILGYANLYARYQDSPNYVDGSLPMNAPEHTANGWINYTFDRGSLEGLSLGVGTYFVGKRPVNEYARTDDGHGSFKNRRPFDMPDYTTINAQLGYSYKNATLRVFANNIFDKIGYTSYYRGGYINEIAPRNFAAQLTYSF